MEIMHYLLSVLLLTSASGLPVKYDQRQEGELNVHAHLENFIFVFIPSSSINLLDYIPLRRKNTQLKPEASNEEKLLSHGTGTKVSAPDFPAGKSPYKVNINKSGDETNEKEVLIAYVPSSLISSSQNKAEGEHVDSTTLNYLDDDLTTTLIETVPPAAEKVQNDISTVNSDKKENSPQKTQIKEEKKDGEKTEVKEDKKEEQKTEVKVEKKDDVKSPIKDEKKNEGDVKLDQVPVVDAVPGKPAKVPKSIDFGIEAAKPRLQSVTEKETSRVEYPSMFKTIKFPTHRQEVAMGSPVGSDEYALRLKLLRTGMDGCEPGEVMGGNGECIPASFEQRGDNYFSSLPDDRLLPVLQFGISPANADGSD